MSGTGFATITDPFFLNFYCFLMKSFIYCRIGPLFSEENQEKDK